MVTPKGTLVRALLGYAGILQNPFGFILESLPFLLFQRKARGRIMQRAVVIQPYFPSLGGTKVSILSFPVTVVSNAVLTVTVTTQE